MRVVIARDKQDLGRSAAEDGTQRIRQALAARGTANAIVATGASQFEMLAALTRAQGIPWNRVTFFHLDEYLGMSVEHPASFRRYLWERFVSRLPLPPRAFHFLDAEAKAEVECQRVGRLIADHPIDVAFVGIGENGHLAFNDPPADFQGETPYIVVDLDEGCRRQQLGEGWFKTLAEVPTQAISMSIRQIMKATAIVCTVPDARKARAVRAAVEGPVTPDVPASILQRHAAATLYLDPASAQLLAIGGGADGREAVEGMLQAGIPAPISEAATIARAPAIRVNAIDHVTFVVKDLERSRKFYVEALGMRAVPRPAFSFAGMWFQAGKTQIHLILEFAGSAPAGNLLAAERRSSLAQHVAFEVEDAAAAVGRLNQLGIPIVDGPKPRPDGYTQVFVTDPDGHKIELCSAPS